MDDVFFEDLDQGDIERIEEEDNDAPVGPDEAEEEKITSARDVKPKKIISKPRLKLDDKRLKGPRGLCVLEPVFKNIKLKGHGHERKDLDTVMSVLEHWAHRLFPKMTFDDCLEKIEDLGHKKSVSSYVTMIRLGCGEEVPEVRDEVVDRRSPSPEQPPVDPFDSLLDQPVQSQLTQEQRERMERNQLIAIERRRAKLKAKYEKGNSMPSVDTNNINNDVIDTDRTVVESEETGVNSDPIIVDENSSSAFNNVNEDIAHDIADHGFNTINEDLSDSCGGEKVEREMAVNDLSSTNNIDSNECVNPIEENVERTVELPCSSINKDIVGEKCDLVDSSIASTAQVDDANEAMDVDFINFDENNTITSNEALIKSNNDANSQTINPGKDSVSSEAP